MGLPDYQIAVISCTTGQTLRIFGMLEFYSLRYRRALNAVGVLVAVLPYAAALEALFAWDNFIEVYRTSPLTELLILEETYLVRSRQRFRADNEERLVVGGVSLNQLLMRRIVDPADDPAATAGYSVKSGVADTVMRAYVREQAADLASTARKTPGLTVSNVAGVGLPVNKSARYVNLFTVINDLSQGGGMDFQISRGTGAALVMDIERIGSVRTVANYPGGSWVGINPNRGNLSDPSLAIDRTDEHNYVYALGQGQGAARQLVKVASADATLTPFNRCEFVKDARNVEQTNVAGLTSAAYEALADQKVVTEFEFQPTGVEAGSIYRKNWDVGDSITAQWGDFQQDLRITGIEITLDDSGEDLTVTGGDQYDQNLS